MAKTLRKRMKRLEVRRQKRDVDVNYAKQHGTKNIDYEIAWKKPGSMTK